MSFILDIIQTECYWDPCSVPTLFQYVSCPLCPCYQSVDLTVKLRDHAAAPRSHRNACTNIYRICLLLWVNTTPVKEKIYNTNPQRTPLLSLPGFILFPHRRIKSPIVVVFVPTFPLSLFHYCI